MDKKNIFIVLFLLLVAGYFVYFSPEPSIDQPSSEYSGDCYNLSFDNTSYCLRDKVREFYNYTRSKDTPKSEEYIKEFGGDCYDYTLLYYNWLNHRGFDVEKKVIKVNKTSAHTFAILKDYDGYCILDQTKVWCFKYGNRS